MIYTALQAIVFLEAPSEFFVLFTLTDFWQQYQAYDWSSDAGIIAAPSRKKEGDWGRGREMRSGAQTRRQIIFCTQLIIV